MPTPAGEESSDDAVALERSRRRRPSGRSAHHQRPFGRGLGQKTRGDQGDPEGPSGETGQAPPAMKPPLPTSGQLALPPTLLPRGSSHHHRVLVGQRNGSKRDEIRMRLRLGRVAGQSGPTRPVRPAHLDEDLVVGVALLPRPISCRFNDRLAKVRRNSGLRQLHPRLNETRTGATLVQHVVK